MAPSSDGELSPGRRRPLGLPVDLWLSSALMECGASPDPGEMLHIDFSPFKYMCSLIEQFPKPREEGGSE